MNRRGRRGGSRVGAGAPRRNLNGQRKLAWLSSYDLSTSEGIAEFLRELIKASWTGKIGSRVSGSLNGSLRLLLEAVHLPELERRVRVLEERRRVVSN
jgi:hypothetical protein